MGAVGQGRANDIIHREGGRERGRGETGSIRSCWSKALKGGRPDTELRGSGKGARLNAEYRDRIQLTRI